MALIIASFIEASAYQKQPLKGEAYLFHNPNPKSAVPTYLNSHTHPARGRCRRPEHSSALRSQSDTWTSYSNTLAKGYS